VILTNIPPYQISSEIPSTPVSTLHQGNPGLKHPEATLRVPRAVQKGGVISITMQPNIPILRRDRNTEKAPVKSISTWVEVKGISLEH
jgi:hypothetical protein